MLVLKDVHNAPALVASGGIQTGLADLKMDTPGKTWMHNFLTLLNPCLFVFVYMSDTDLSFQIYILM